MSIVESTDIVILGGGVSGLLLAGTLSEKHSVLVLEKAERLRVEKYWLTDAPSVAANPEFRGALDGTYTTMDFIAYDGTTFRASGEYHLWHSENLLRLLSDRVIAAGGRILYGQQFYSVQQSLDSITVLANDRAIRCRLIVDCMGHSSPIVHAKGVVDVLGYYLLYGATFPQTKELVPVGLHNMMLSGHPGYVEAFPTADSRLHIVLIVPVQRLGRTSDLKEDFSFIVSKSPYAKHIDSPVSSERRFLGGIVPVGHLRRRALDRIFFFGEAGQINPAASATALTRMLLGHRAIAAHLFDCLEHNAVSAKDLAPTPNSTTPFNERIQRALFRNILQWRSDEFKEVIEELIRLNDTAVVNALVFGDLPDHWSSLASLAARLFQSKSKTLLKALVRGVVPIT
ncbi:MAG TPA: lycopene cyclase family protein [Thermoanaerobaculia bacterium]